VRVKRHGLLSELARFEDTQLGCSKVCNESWDIGRAPQFYAWTGDPQARSSLADNSTAQAATR